MMGGLLGAGYASRDITPREAVPLWGYARELRPQFMSAGLLDPLYARALVIQSGGDRLALVSLDLGRAPQEGAVDAIRETVARTCGITHLFITATHTHHGPALELHDPDRLGDGAYAAAARYCAHLQDAITEAIGGATDSIQDARIGWDTVKCPLNRNRHATREPIPCDPNLVVVRIDDCTGSPIAVIANYAAHPTLHPPQNNRFTAEYPGVMARAVHRALEAPLLFIQGAAGDLQCDIDDSLWRHKDFQDEVGEAIAHHVVDLAGSIATHTPPAGSIPGQAKEFECSMRINVLDPAMHDLFVSYYFPEMADSVVRKYNRNVMAPRLQTAVIGGSLFLAGVSGEFFCEHAINLRAALPGATVLFCGYCNGHDMYFPTKRAADEGGYGADTLVAWAELGVAERMMEDAAAQFCAYARNYKTGPATG